jgi:hypothetical protein
MQHGVHAAFNCFIYIQDAYDICMRIQSKATTAKAQLVLLLQGWLPAQLLMRAVVHTCSVHAPRTGVHAAWGCTLLGRHGLDTACGTAAPTAANA